MQYKEQIYYIIMPYGVALLYNNAKCLLIHNFRKWQHLILILDYGI